MNIDNIEFVKEFADRTQSYNSFVTRCQAAYSYNRELGDAEHRVVQFLNGSVLATGTSSLKKTNVLMPKDDSYGGSHNSVVTFNHKGMGRLYVPTPGGYNYGTTYSREFDSDDFLKAYTNDVLMQEIINDLIKTNNMKLLKTLNDVLNVKQDVLNITNITKKYVFGTQFYNRYPQIVLENPIVVLIPIVSEKNELFMKKMTVRKIVVNSDKQIMLYSQVESLEKTHGSITDQSNEPYNDSEEYTSDRYIMLFADIDSPIVYMQAPEEFNTILDSLNAQLEVDVKSIDVSFTKIQDNLSVYALLKTIKDGGDD